MLLVFFGAHKKPIEHERGTDFVNLGPFRGQVPMRPTLQEKLSSARPEKALPALLGLCVWPPRLFSARHLVTLHRREGEREGGEQEKRERNRRRFLSAAAAAQSNTQTSQTIGRARTGFCLCPSHNHPDSRPLGYHILFHSLR